MSTEYHKIQTAWLRDPETGFKTLIEGAWAKPEFEYLAGTKWVFTEKVDGTNMRLTLDGIGYRIGGKTDNAQVPAFLNRAMQEIGNRALLAGLDQMTLYGEGYGAKIQSGGKYRPDGCDFVLFDVFAGGLWLERASVEDIAAKAGISVVPIVGTGTLRDAIEATRAGMRSTWGDFMSEGLIMRPAVELQNRCGERVIAKIKHKDFAPAKARGET